MLIPACRSNIIHGCDCLSAHGHHTLDTATDLESVPGYFVDAVARRMMLKSGVIMGLDSHDDVDVETFKRWKEQPFGSF